MRTWMEEVREELMAGWQPATYSSRSSYGRADVGRRGEGGEQDH